MVTTIAARFFGPTGGTFATTAALIVLQGCAVDVGDSSGSAKLRDNVEIIDQQMMDGAVVEEGRLLIPMTGNTWLSGIDKGDIVVSNAGLGYLRRVTNVQQDGDYAVLQTETASITDAVEQAELHHTFGDGAGFDPDRAEIVDFGIDINYDGTVLYEQDGLRVELSQGNLNFRPTLDFDMDVSWGRIKEFQLIATGNLDANLVVTATAAQSFSGSKQFTTTIFRSQPKIFVHTIGFLPVVEVITGTVDAHFEISAEVAGTAQVGVTANATVEAGMRLEGGELAPITDTGLDFEPVGPTLKVSGQVSAKAILEPRLEVAFYGAAGASVGVQAFSELAAQSDVDASVEGVEFSGSCDLLLGVSGDVRAELPVFAFSGFQRELFRLDRSIDCGTW